MRALIFLILAFVIIAADQASKWYVMEHILRPQLEQTENPPPDLMAWYQTTSERIAPAQMQIMPNFNLVSGWNFGISFGMFQHVPVWILVSLSVVISLIFLVWLLRAEDKMQSLGIVMVIGGAMGNVVDRLRFGAVFDFLDFHAFDYHWPAFNIADSGIVVGVIVLMVHSLFFEKKHQG